MEVTEQTTSSPEWAERALRILRQIGIEQQRILHGIYSPVTGSVRTEESMESGVSRIGEIREHWINEDLDAHAKGTQAL